MLVYALRQGPRMSSSTAAITKKGAIGGSGCCADPPRAGKSEKDPTRLSRALSWALRHKAVELGLHMTSDGYVPVDEILRCPHAKFRGAPATTLADIRRVVETSDKQRYKLSERPASNYGVDSASGTILCIRANQGHSIALVNPDLLLERLTTNELARLPIIVHGTYRAAWQSIQAQGLKRMKRNHIHFATGLPSGDNGAISGMRKSCEVYIYINPQKCADDGVAFYRSENGVLLTAGVNDEGTLPAAYISHATDAAGMILTTELD